MSNRGLPPKVKAFILHVYNECVKHGVKMHTTETQGVVFNELTGEQSNGYFDDDKKVLAVAIGKPLDQWLPILAHEYGHMTQWLEDCDAWKGYKPGYEAGMAMEMYLGGFVELSDSQKLSVLKAVAGLEHDNEKRTIDLIIKFELPIDVVAYAQKANAYVLFHHVILKHRRWYTLGKEPYNLYQVWSKMPKKMVKDVTKITQAQFKALEKCFA